MFFQTLIVLFVLLIIFQMLRKRFAHLLPRRSSRWKKMNIPSDAQSAFIVCTFSMLGKLAQADGRVSSQERERINRYIDEKLQLDRKTKTIALKVFQDSFESPLELRDYAERFQSEYRDRVLLLDSTIEILLEVSIADGDLDPKEDELILSAALLLGLSEAGYRRIKEKVLGPPKTVH